METLRGCLVQGNREWEMKSHSISPSFLCLDKFDKNVNEMKINFEHKQTPTSK